MNINSPDAQEILKQRAQTLAKTITQIDKQDRAKYLKIEIIPNEYFGIPYQYLEEILYLRNITPVPRVADYITGVVNWRSKILTVLELRKILKLEYDQKNQQTPWIIVLKQAKFEVGIAIYNVIGNEYYADKELSKSLKITENSQQEIIAGIINGNIAIFNIDAIFKQYVEKNHE